jgi:hypothetical protein
VLSRSRSFLCTVADSDAGQVNRYVHHHDQAGRGGPPLQWVSSVGPIRCSDVADCVRRTVGGPGVDAESAGFWAEERSATAQSYRFFTRRFATERRKAVPRGARGDLWRAICHLSATCHKSRALDVARRDVDCTGHRNVAPDTGSAYRAKGRSRGRSECVAPSQLQHSRAHRHQTCGSGVLPRWRSLSWLCLKVSRANGSRNQDVCLLRLATIRMPLDGLRLAAPVR